MRNTRWAIALGVAAALMVGAYLLLRSPGTPPPPPVPLELLSHSAHPPPPPSAGHAAEIDRSMGSILALYRAPEGGTLCETAYNAFEASRDYAARENTTAAVLRLAPRDEFLRRCDALPPASQRCMVPLYMTQHKDECQQVKPADDVFAAMVELKPRVTGPPPVPPPSPSEPPQ